MVVSSFISNSKLMKKFLLISAVLFGAVFALLLVNEKINLWLIFSSTNTRIYKMHRLFNKFPMCEIPILGSSRAEAGFVPSELSPSAFNYGLSGSSQGETLLHVRAVCQRNDARLVIVNLDPWGIGGLGNFQGDYSLVSDSTLLSEYQDYTKIHISDRIPGTRFYGCLRPNLAEYLNSVMAATKSIDQGAILQRLSRNEEEWAYIIARCSPQPFVCVDKVWSQYLQVFAEHPQIQFIFVVSPVSKPWWERFEGKDQLAAFLTEAETIPNLTVIDLCTPNIDRYDLSFYMDLTHLNETGARKFTRELREELVRRGLLEN